MASGRPAGSSVELVTMQNFVAKTGSLRFYTDLNAMFDRGSMSTAVFTVNRLKAVPFIVTHTKTLAEIVAEVTALAAGGVFRLGVYAADPATRYPSTLLYDSGELLSSSNGRKTANPALVLTPGYYWAAANAGVLAATFRSWGIGASQGPLMAGVDASSPPVLQGVLDVAQAYGALPNPYTAGGTMATGVFPAIWGLWS